MSDLIDRELLIEQIKEDSYGNEGSYGDMWRFMDTINKMPSVQPETNCSEIPNNSDLISRTAAIDAVDKRFDDIPMEQTQEILLLRRDLRTLPSVQPEYWMERNKERILQAGMEGREIEFRIGGRLFAIREKAQ